MKISIRSMMLLVAVAAVVLVPCLFVVRILSGAVFWSPSQWAYSKGKGQVGRMFERRQEGWGEMSSHGPYTDGLARGARVVVAETLDVQTLDPDGSRGPTYHPLCTIHEGGDRGGAFSRG